MEYFTYISRPYKGAPGSIRLFAWSDLIVDIDVKTGTVIGKAYGR
jgi:hypothetical protein